MAVDGEGNAWVVDAGLEAGKGMQVTKFSPDGKVLLKLGKPAQGKGSSALDVFDEPTGVAIASNGELVEVNPEETSLSRFATHLIREPAAVALPRLVDEVLIKHVG